jgi:hypothetical protein
MTIPTTRGAKLRALRAVGIKPKLGADGKRHIDAAPVIDALHEAGVHDGIAAFPPPGTDPPKSGVIVPETWALPEGYVRHYQTTDDGKPLPPILMFHPDYEFADENGNPIVVPEDRVVPPSWCRRGSRWRCSTCRAGPLSPRRGVPRALGHVTASPRAPPFLAVAALVVAPWHWLYWVVLVPWLLALDAHDDLRGAVGSGIAMAVAFSVAVFSWFPVAIGDYATVPVSITALVSLAAAPLFQPQFVAFALVRHGARRAGLGIAGAAAAGAFAYVGAEWALPKLFGDTLGLGLHPSRWIRQAAAPRRSGPPTLASSGNECVRASIVALRERVVDRVLAPLAVLALIVAALATYGRIACWTSTASRAGRPSSSGSCRRTSRTTIGWRPRSAPTTRFGRFSMRTSR